MKNRKANKWISWLCILSIVSVYLFGTTMKSWASESTYKELTFSDWGVKDGVLHTIRKEYTIEDNTVTDVANIALSGKITFTQSDKYVGIGGPSSENKKLAALGVRQGLLVIRDFTGNGGRHTVLSPGELNTEYDIRITIDAIENSTDLLVTCYLEGQQVVQYTSDATDRTPNLQVAEGISLVSVSTGNDIHEQLDDIYCNLTKTEGYYVGNFSGVTIDGETYAQGEIFSYVGEYSLSYRTDGKFVYSGNLIIYYPGDVDVDGVITEQDLSLMKTALESNPSMNKASEMALDINMDGNFDEMDIQVLENFLDIDNREALILSPVDGEEVKLANELVDDFITDFERCDSTKFYPNDGGDNYHMQPVMLSWMSADKNAQFIIEISTSNDMSDAKQYQTEETYLELINLLVNTDYYWKVTTVHEDGTSSESKVMRFHTEHTIRTITIDGVSNSRDLGGVITEDGRVVKQGMIYRAGELDNITNKGKEQIADFGIKTDLDLRNEGLGQSPLGSDVNLIDVQGVYYLDEGNSIADPAQFERMRQEVAVFADEENYPIMIHCSLGRDRTGTLAFMIYGLLGVDINTIYRDYEISVLSTVGYAIDEELLNHLNVQIQRTYEYIFDNYEGNSLAEKTENYLVEIGITRAEINNIRNIMLEGTQDPSLLSDVDKHKLAVQNFEKISIEHFGFDDQTYTESKDSGEQDFSIFNTMFTAKIEAAAVGEIWPYTELHYAKSDSWDGIRIFIASTQMVVYKGEEVLEYWKEEFAGQFEFSISTELFDSDGDGEDDVRMGFWLNGVLLGDEVHVIENGKELLIARMALEHNTEQDWTLKSATTQPEEPTEPLTDAEAHKLAVKNFRKTCIEDFGIAEKNYTESVDSGTVAGLSVLNTVFTTTLKAAEASDNFSRFCYAVPAGKDLTYGILVQIVPEGNQIDFLGKKADGTKLIDTTTYWNREFSKEFQLSISTELYDADGDGLDDVRLGFWLNGVLLGDKVHVIIDGKQDFSTARIGFNRIGEQDFLLEKSAMQIGDEFEVITPADFGAENVKTSGVDFHTYSTENVTSLNGKIFSTDIRFGAESSRIIYGADSRYEDTGEYELYLGTYEEGQFVFHDAAWEFASKELYDYKAGVILKDHFFNLKISSKNVDCNGDGVYDDLEIGLWFNDKLYDNRYFYYEGRADLFLPKLGYSTTEGTTLASGEIIWGNYVQETPTEVLWDLASGYYYADILDGETLKIGATEYTDSQILALPGIYDVEYTENGGQSIFKDTVTVYLTNDIRGDGTVDVRDLVAMKLYESDKRELDFVGELAIGVGAEEYSHNVALSSIRAELVSEEEYIVSKEFSQEIVGATGSNTYITYAGATEKGTSVLGISVTSDDYVPNLDELNKYETDYILDFNFEEDRDIRVLQLSDTQIIDSAQAGEGRLHDWSISKYDISHVNELLFNEMDALVAAQKPDFITIAGDVVYGEFDNNGTVLQMVIEKMDSYQIPWAPIFGNHDNETTLGADWQCEQFMKSTYCIFNQNNQYGGNGNYSVAISKKGEVQRLIFMVDTHGCYMVDDPISPGYLPEQLAWYRDVAAQVSVAAGKQIPSFIFQHYPGVDVASLLMDKGYRHTMSSKRKIDLGLTSDGMNDFGFINSPDVPEFRQYMYPQYQAAGTDGVFFGHSHINSLSATYKGVRYTFGLKTGRYVSAPDQTGGTMITISNEGAFVVEHIVQRDITTEDD